VREHGSKVVELARRHGFAEFDSDRADNRLYEDEPFVFGLGAKSQADGYLNS